VKDRILNFLRAQPEQAFALHEIWCAMNNVPNASYVAMMIAMLASQKDKRLPEVVALEELQREGLVASNVVDGVMFVYAVSK
jgi:hypothetical protein